MKLTEWMKDVGVLSDMAKTEPHAAHSAYTYSLQHWWNFFRGIIPCMSPLLRPLRDSIRNTFISALLKSPTLGNDERVVFELIPRMGGMGITSPVKMTDVEN